MSAHGMNVLSRLALAIASLIVVVSCGSGSVGPPPVNDPTKVTVLPKDNGCTDPTSIATCVPVVLYSGLPTTFSITGGTGAYIVTSTNQAVLPVSGNINGGSLTVVPNPVVADTTLLLTARDTGTATPTTVTLLVRPGTVSNAISITPGSSACSPAICSGGDALVAATISQGGIPLPARGVRFEVVSGDFQFITSPAGATETLANSVTTVTDEAGVARSRLRASTTAANQTGILQVTDLGSGAYQRTSIFIARATTTQSSFFTIPTSISYVGPDKQTCASSGALASEVFIFGGTPPYTISTTAPGAFLLNTNVVAVSGGSVRVTPAGACVDNAQLAITDAAARTISVSLSNKVGTIDPVTALAVTPNSLSLNSCAATSSAIIVGGTGTYVAGGDTLVLASVSGGLLTVSRKPGPLLGAPATGASVIVGDGKSTVSVPVALSGTASTGPCP